MWYNKKYIKNRKRILIKRIWIGKAVTTAAIVFTLAGCSSGMSTNSSTLSSQTTPSSTLSSQQNVIPTQEVFLEGKSSPVNVTVKAGECLWMQSPGSWVVKEPDTGGMEGKIIYNYPPTRMAESTNCSRDGGYFIAKNGDTSPFDVILTQGTKKIVVRVSVK